MLQHEGEFTRLLEIYTRRRPSRVLEVGVHLGGTLYHWLRHGPTATIVAIDANPDAHAIVSHLAQELHHPDTTCITGDSTDPGVVATAALRGPYDWVFLDADHTEQAVRTDWLSYGQILAAPGATVALHDIRPRGDPTIQVDRLWEELVNDYDTLEIDEGGHGIGVVTHRTVASVNPQSGAFLTGGTER